MDDKIVVGLTPKKKAELKQIMGKYSGKASLSFLLRLSREKLEEITIHPKVKDGKLLFDRNNKDHRYIVEDGEGIDNIDDKPSVKDCLIQAFEEVKLMREGLLPKKSWDDYIKEQKELGIGY